MEDAPVRKVEGWNSEEIKRGNASQTWPREYGWRMT